MAREQARTGEDKIDLEANKALAADFEELRTRKLPPSAEDKAKLAAAREKAKFVRDVTKPSGAERRVMGLPHAHDVIIPVSEEDAALAWDAQAQLRELEASERALNAELLKADGQEYQYFLRCRSCYSHAMYFTRAVTDGEVLGDKDWFSRYKPDPSTQWRQRLLCQKCLMEGTERDVSVEIVDWRKGTFRVDARWLRKVPKDPVRAAREGSIRVCELPLTTQNVVGTIAD